MQSLRKNGHHRLHRAFIMATHNGKGDGGPLWSMYLFVTPPSFLCPSHKRMNVFSLSSSKFLERPWNLTWVHTLCPKVFLERCLVFTRGASVVSSNGHFSFFLYSNRCSRCSGKRPPARRRQIRASETKTLPPLLDDNCMWLCLRLVYLWVFDHDSMRRCLIPGVLWQFCRLAKGPPVSEVRSEETGAWKAGVQLGEDQKRRKL